MVRYWRTVPIPNRPVPKPNNVSLNRTRLTLTQFLSNFCLKLLHISIIGVLISVFNDLKTFRVSVHCCWKLSRHRFSCSSGSSYANFREEIPHRFFQPKANQTNKQFSLKNSSLLITISNKTSVKIGNRTSTTPYGTQKDQLW